MAFRRRTRSFLPVAAVALVLLAWPAFAAGVSDQLPDPDGKPADMSKPVKVFILMGQSNMVGFGNSGQLKEMAKTAPVTAEAQEAFALDEIVVTGAVTAIAPQPLNRTGATVEVMAL